VVKRFSRCREDFVCEHCGAQVIGDGYTNHCPSCLYSKHVDIQPGDRRELCLGPMEPVSVEVSREKYVVVHRCLKCGVVRRNKAVKDDDVEVMIRLSARPRAL